MRNMDHSEYLYMNVILVCCRGAERGKPVSAVQ